MLLTKILLRATRSIITQKYGPFKINFVQMSTLKQQLNTIKVKRPTPKSEIVSLHSDQLQELERLNHYATSVSYLQKNDLLKSYNYLQFALTQSKSKFPESVNLHMFLLNRISILQKLLGESQKFLNTLEEVFFMSQSLKGDKSLQTIKHLRNYLTALVISDPIKLKSLFQFLTENKSKILLKRCDEFVGISQYLNGEKQNGLKIIQQSKAQGEQKKYIKLNNHSWLKLLSLSNDTLQFVPQQKIKQIDIIIKNLIQALSNAQKHCDLTSSSAQIQKNLLMTSILNQFLQKGQDQNLKKIYSKTLLLNSQSHIICMNIAHAFYIKRKLDLTILFMKLSLQAALQFLQPYRVGLGLVLMSKVNQKLKMMWEPTLLDILKNKQVYSLSVLKECLICYSRFLFIEKRYYESEAYANQSQKIEARLYAQGLVLPDFDFTY